MNGKFDRMKDDHDYSDTWSRAGPTGPSGSTTGHYGTGATIGQTSSLAGDPYGMQSYHYPSATMFPYSGDHVSTAGAWSNGQDMTFLTGGYGTADGSGPGPSAAHYMNAMFSSSNYGYNSFSPFFPSGSTADPFWGSTATGQKQRGHVGLGAWPTSSGPYGRMHDMDGAYSHYGHRDSYGDVSGGVSLKHVESGMAGLTLDHIKSDQFSKAGAFGSSNIDSKKFDSVGSVGSSSSGPVGPPKKTTWASIASQPAKSQPKSLKSKMSGASSVLSSGGKVLPPPTPLLEPMGSWDAKNGQPTTSAVSQVQPSSQPTASSRGVQQSQPQQQTNIVNQNSGSNWGNSGGRHQAVSGGPVSNAAVTPPTTRTSHQQHHPQQHHQQPTFNTSPNSISGNQSNSRPVVSTGSANNEGGRGVIGSSSAGAINNNADMSSVTSNSVTVGSHPVLENLRRENNYNPKDFDLNPKNARFFIIKSYSEDDIHRSIKYSIWCSTEHGNKRLDTAFKQQESTTKGPIYLLYSVNGSGHFCGMAQMMSPVDYNSSSNVWAQDKWKGQFKVKWIYVKDVPNAQLRHIRLENNENKPVTNSRDTQEVPLERGKAVIKIMHHYRHTTSIFDDFMHYEKRQEEEKRRMVKSS